MEGTFVVRLGADGGGSSRPIGTQRKKGEGDVGTAFVIGVLLRLRLPRELHGRASLWISREEEGAGRS